VVRKPSRDARRRSHSCATTTPRDRRAIQASKETNTLLAKRYGANRKTIAKWKAREFTSDARMGPKKPRAGLLTQKEVAIILVYRWRTRLALNDSHLRLRCLMPKLSRSALYRCLKRHGLSRIGPTATCPPLTTPAMNGPHTFEISAHEVVFPDPVLGLVFPVLLAVEEITKQVYAEIAEATPEKAAAFLGRLVDQTHQKIVAVTTEIDAAFADWTVGFNEDIAAFGPHPFAIACRARGIVHTRSTSTCTKPPKIGSPDLEIRQRGGPSSRSIGLR
jgi:hypothetical protein